MQAEILAIRDLTDECWREVLAFAADYFEGSPEALRANIAAKHDLVLLRSRGRLVGMGAIECFELEQDGRTASFVHVGNTAFAEEARGQGQIQRLGFETFLRMRLAHPLRPIYLVYTTFSWRTYAMLVRNFRVSWPRLGHALPPWEAGLYEQLGRRILGAHWEPERGLGRGLGRKLRAEVARIPDRLADDPDLRWFAEHNPGYVDGDVLLCLTPLDARNWLAVLGNAVRRRRRPRR